MVVNNCLTGSIDIIKKCNSAKEAIEILLKTLDGVLVIEKYNKLKDIVTICSLVNTIKINKDFDNKKHIDIIVRNLYSTSSDPNLEKAIDVVSNEGAQIIQDEEAKYIVAKNVNIIHSLFKKIQELEREISFIIDYSSDEIFITDGKGNTLRANSNMENEFGEKMVGKNVKELEKAGVFSPSVTRLVLDHKTTETIIQTCFNGREYLATGIPVFNDDGSLFRVIGNIRDLTKLNSLKNKLKETENLKNNYYQELIEMGKTQRFYDKLLIKSQAMIKLMKEMRKLSLVDSTVLLTGESGVGKGLIANYIHESSCRNNKPFIAVNCGAIPENLLESELFGYISGAFTGADKKGRIGKLELANFGTIFLDEITDLPLNLQVKLLHAIEQKTICRIGDNKTVDLDIRIIAATNQSIDEMLAKGLFREDLFYRICVTPLEVPPLRERTEDIEPLSQLFLIKYNKKYHQQKNLDKTIITCMQKYRWPGNVRELENLIERLVIVVDDDLITVDHLPHNIVGSVGRINNDMPSLNSTSELEFISLNDAKENIERELFDNIAKRCKSTYEIAKKLKISQSTVVRRLKKYNISFSKNVTDL